MIMSKIQLSPYVNFQGRAREAMEFYHKVLGGKLDLQTLNEQGVSKPAGPGDSVRHARLQADGALIVATDGHPNYPAKVGDNMAIALGGTDKGRLTEIFNALAEGGKIQGPLAKQPWGADVGWLRDKFGINWTVSIDKA
jgi:PhnB protein